MMLERCRKLKTKKIDDFEMQASYNGFIVWNVPKFYFKREEQNGLEPYFVSPHC
jgi:hypothetical protein